MAIDTDEEIKKLRKVCFAGFMFLVATYFSYKELKYQIWGEEAVATIHRVAETSRSKGRFQGSEKMHRLEYTFNEANGTQRTENIVVPLDWAIPADNKLELVYLPGEKRASRLKGTVAWNSVIFFFFGLAWLSWELFKLIREARDAAQGKPLPRYRTS